MKKHTVDKRHLRWILPSLVLVIACAVLLDFFPLSRNSDIPAQTTQVVDALATLTPDSETEISHETTNAPEEQTTAPETDAETTAAADAPLPSPTNDVTLTFLGVCSPGSPLGTMAYGSLNATVQKEGADYFFSGLYDILAKDDLTLAATNCVLTDTVSTKSLSCAGPAANADIYQDGSIEFVSLASPMETVYEEDLLEETRSALEARNIQHAGNESTTYFSFGEIDVAVYCTYITKGKDPATDRANILAASETAGYVIVYFWCDEVRSGDVDAWLSYYLHQLSDAGAQLIVGCGNSEVLPVEEYQSTKIVYSLGTVIDGSSFQKGNSTALLRVTLYPDSAGTVTAKTEWIYCSTSENRWQPQIITDTADTSQSVDSSETESSLPLTDR